MAALDIVTTLDLNVTTDLLGVGHLYYGVEGSGVFTEIAIPAGVTGLNRRPSHVEDRQHRRYVAGQWNKLLVLTEFKTLHVAGIAGPAAAPGLTSTTGGALTGNHIGYIAFRHKSGSTIVHESNLSPGSATLTLTGTEQRVWTLPGSAPETRVTHVVLYVSVDGALPKEVTELAITAVTHTENTATGALGDPPPVDSDGNLKQARGVPPYTRFVVKYHRRAWYGGDPAYPARWWYSELDEFESVGILNYVEHLETEAVVGGGPAGDHIVSFGQTVSYAIQGWDEADLRVYKLSPSIGLTSHFGIVNINEILWFPSELGVYMYIPGAGFRPLMHRDLQSYWRDEYAANPAAFEDCTAGDDRTQRLFKLLVPYATAPKARYFVGHYQNFDSSVGEGGSLPDWTFDLRDRDDYAVGNLRPIGKRRTDLHVGSGDGYVRLENVAANDDDDGDTYQKLMEFDGPHYLPTLQVGDDNEGSEFNELTMFLVSETSDWTIEGRAGDDFAYLATSPAWTKVVKASGKTVGNKTYVAKSAHHLRPTGLSGKGVIFRVKIPKAKGVEYRGLALGWGNGQQSRPLI